MVPPDSLFGAIPTWVGVYLIIAIAAFGAAGYFLYQRVFKLVLVGKPAERFDQPIRRLIGALPLIFGQRKVLQRVSLKDRAGLAHFFIFWGFLSFTLSYLLFIFGDSLWHPLSSKILTETGLKAFTIYLDILAVLFLVILVLAAIRRWVVTPSRLKFDLTQKKESGIILGLIALLMIFTLLTEAFYVAGGGTGPHAVAPVGGALGSVFSGAVNADAANVLQAIFWWGHLAIILGFAIYIPLSKHMHLVGAPINFFTRSLEARGHAADAD